MPGPADTQSERLDLVDPCEEHLDAFLAYARACLPAETNPYMRQRFEEALADPAGHLRRERGFAAGRNLPPGYVPASTYWLVRDGRDVVARSSLRHRLTAHLLHEGGHIGYSVRPAERGKGYGTAVCRLTIERARALGLGRVLITCDADNPASARIIEKCGGVYENEVRSRATGKMKRRYWVDLTRPAPGHPGPRDSSSRRS
ncbi:MAG: GNAT family N-acetyltransferase [Planctomycetes bacterium]|nr:GNAT family N-acetyltransferase [Planctomycetota bacterium]